MTRQTRKIQGRRQSGRPAGLRAGVLQDALLDAAEACFGEQGFDATPVRQVAEMAGVNPALVHYYFGTKDQLLTAVLDRAFEPLADAVAALGSARPVEPQAIIDLLIGTFAEHPALPRLIVREVMLTAGPLRERFIRDYAPRLGGALPPLLAREQDGGRLRGSIDPGVLTLALLSLCVFPFVARSVAEPVMGLDYDAEGLDQLRTGLGELVSNGVKT